MKAASRTINLLALILCCTLGNGFVTVTAAAQEVTVDADLLAAFPDLPKATDTGKPVQLRYNFKSGDQRTWRLRIDSKMDVMGMVMPKLDEFVVKSVYDTTESGFQVTSQIKDMVSEMRTRGGSLVIDTANPEREMADAPFVPFVKMWKVIRENKLTCNFSAEGLLDEFAVPEPVSQVVKESGQAYGISADDMMASLIVGIVQLPKRQVSVGENWDMNVLIPPMNAKDNSQSGTFLGTAHVDGREMALIQVEFSSNMEERSGMISDFESTSTAMVLFDIEAGELYRSYTVIESEMVMHLGDNEVLQSSSGISTIDRIDD